ncbi:MAG: D-serine ammonia-lyase [Desulfobacter sp.]
MTETYRVNPAIDEWIDTFPLLTPVMSGQEVLWANPEFTGIEAAMAQMPLSGEDIADAGHRLERFAPYLARVFPETGESGGMIESPLKPVPGLQAAIGETWSREIPGTLLLKCDSHLAVSGSIKARGGIYEVLAHAERLAIEQGMLTADEDYCILDSDRFRRFFSQYTIAVGSTGNLGLSIGIMGAQLGFKVFVHMSSDAKSWKKTLLREKGVGVVEHDADYTSAVANGRAQAEKNPHAYFIDDENSTDLFLGYAVAASRLKRQLEELNIRVSSCSPLFVYLPCGVGGGPGGITFGLKQVFGDHVHCFFAEPVSSPCMLLGLMTGRHDRISVRDVGLDNITDADGLAVPRPSGFVGRSMGRMISGVYTVSDPVLYRLLAMTADTEGLRLEPSALAGMPGPARLCHETEGTRYLADHGLAGQMAGAVHIVWATGGSMVPEEVMDGYYALGRR